MVQRIGIYKTTEVENNRARDVEFAIGAKDNGKKHEVGIKINEPVKVIQIHNTMSPSNIKLEKRRKEREAIVDRLQIAKN